MQKNNYSIISLSVRGTNLTDFEITFFDSNRMFAENFDGVLAVTAGVKYWTSVGGLYYAIDNISGGEFCIIESSTYPYRSLVEAMKNKKIFIKFIRITATNPLQLLEPFKAIKNTIMGIEDENPIIPNKKPTQVQNNILDVPMNIFINSDKGMKYKILGTGIPQTISFDLICRQIV